MMVTYLNTIAQISRHARESTQNMGSPIFSDEGLDKQIPATSAVFL